MTQATLDAFLLLRRANNDNHRDPMWIEEELSECRKAVHSARCSFGAGSWQHEVCLMELANVERRLAAADPRALPC